MRSLSHCRIHDVFPCNFHSDEIFARTINCFRSDFKRLIWINFPAVDDVIQNLQCDAVCAHTCKLSAFQWVNKCTWIAIQWHLFFLWYAEDIYLEYMKVHRRRDIPIASKIFGLPNNHYKCVSNGVNFQICTQQYATGTFGPTFMAPPFWLFIASKPTKKSNFTTNIVDMP